MKNRKSNSGSQRPSLTKSKEHKNPVSLKSKKQYDVAAFIWPAYYPDDRAKVFWPMGIGEWETVMKNEAKFAGHDQPRIPLWGYVNEADPYVMQMQIEAASDHGVNVFIYDWYWYDGMPYLEGCLNDGYLKAKNNDKVKFYLMWANHDVGLFWDKRNADDTFENRNKSLIWKGAVNGTEFEKICHKVISQYFCHPSYYRIDDKPVFMLYQLDNFINGLGGIQQAVDAVTWFRNETKKAGFKGLELQYSMRGHGIYNSDTNMGDAD
ncbi:MAG TPA: glycoside hydrolase family 99-like domain-containing protein, partial [Methylococcales bacterium]